MLALRGTRCFRGSIPGQHTSSNSARRSRLLPAARCSSSRVGPSDRGDAVDEAQHSRRVTLALGATAAAAALWQHQPPAAHAGLDSYNTTSSDIETVELQLGSTDGQLMFTPSTLTFTAGRVYRLHMTNPSSSTHYVTALEFADKIYTILVLANGVEVKGAVQEVALKKGAEATWMFVPIKPGTYPLRCTVKGHTEGGMVGSFIIQPAPGSQAASAKKK